MPNWNLAPDSASATITESFMPAEPSLLYGFLDQKCKAVENECLSKYQALWQG